MPRARNDPYKRKSAQALNHLAAAILDIYDIYTPFEEQMQMLEGQVTDLLKVIEETNETSDRQHERADAQSRIQMTIENSQRYSQYVKDLHAIMMGISAVRGHIILFIGEVWNLDEESVKVYMA